jgi:hypothetical protein
MTDSDHTNAADNSTLDNFEAGESPQLPQLVETEINAVTVYSDRALIKRQGQAIPIQAFKPCW